MNIDNNHLLARYLDLVAKNRPYLNAVEAAMNKKVDALYQQLATTFADTITFSVDEAVAVAQQAGMALEPAEAEIAVVNFMLKYLNSIGLWIQPQAESDPNTIVAKLNFGNRSRYY